MFDKQWSDQADPEAAALSAAWRAVVIVLALAAVAGVIAAAVWGLRAVTAGRRPVCLSASPVPACPPSRHR